MTRSMKEIPFRWNRNWFQLRSGMHPLWMVKEERAGRAGITPKRYRSGMITGQAEFSSYVTVINSRVKPAQSTIFSKFVRDQYHLLQRLLNL